MTKRELLASYKQQRALVAEYTNAKKAQVKLLDFKYNVLTQRIEKLQVEISSGVSDDE
jgi:hypothetical protein